MPARLNTRQSDKCKEAIKATLIIKKLANHTLNGEEMTQSQVQAGKFLLSLVMPTMKAVEQSVDMTVNVPKSITFRVNNGDS